MPVARAIGPIDAATAQRFWSCVDVRREDECWLWRGATSSSKYEKFTLYGRRFKAHRVAYAIINGGVPEHGIICHTCDTPACVNPRHLFCGTSRDNILDRERKGRGNKSAFTRADVEAMRTLREAGAWYWLIGERYGVSAVHVRLLLLGSIRLKDE
jgi:hypothetical protein